MENKKAIKTKMKFTSILAMIAVANGLGLSAERSEKRYDAEYNQYKNHHNQ